MSEFKVIRNGNPIRGAKLGTEKSILNTVMAVSAQAKALAPVKDGRLRNSIMWKVQGSSGGFNKNAKKKADREIDVNPQEMEGYVGSALDYAIYQEFGTRNMAPQPYLRPAIMSIRARQFKIMIQVDHIKAMRDAMHDKWEQEIKK